MLWEIDIYPAPGQADHVGERVAAMAHSLGLPSGLRVRAGQYPWVALGMLEASKKIVEAQMPRPE